MGYEALRPRVPNAPSIRSTTPPTGRASPSEHIENSPLLFNAAADEWEGGILNPYYNSFAELAESDHHSIIKTAAAE